MLRWISDTIETWRHRRWVKNPTILERFSYVEEWQRAIRLAHDITS